MESTIIKKPKSEGVIKKCESCKHNPATKKHTCPFLEEVRNDKESLCTCCDDCYSECFKNI